MKKLPLIIAFVGLSVLSLGLVACGDDDDEPEATTTTESTTEDPTTSTTEEPTTTTTEEPTTTTVAEPADACATVTPEMVTAVIGEAPEGQPSADSGCAWTASNGNVMGASLVDASTIPDDVESADILSQFGLPTSGYRTTSLNRSTSGDKTAVVIIGYASPQPDDEAADQARRDAVQVVSDALLASLG